ncbi:MAG: gliding motility-associated protein GldE [Muribaculaceae bacterium]|nr:gliding motility-associated protein GldE [Muribaculaceae bacterium]MDE6610547.1 gliding motility-associated protein GldE [Muribaculaceae bacterium]
METPQIIALCLAVIALAISAFVSGSEIAFFSITPDRLQSDEIEDLPVADSIRALLRRPEKLLATILIANNLVNVGIVVLTTFALTPLLAGIPSWQSFLLQSVILTFILLLFGEIVPKLCADSNPVKWVSWATPPVSAIVRIMSPLSSLLVRGSGLVGRVVTKQAENISTDDLSHALELTDVKTPDDKEMLEGILRFGDTTASEIMTPRVDITDIDIAENFTTVLDTVIDSGYSRLPVVGESRDDIRGILYARDLIPYREQDDSFDWRTLVRKPYFVPESRMIDDLMEDFRKLKIHMAIVVDEFGGTQGLVTLEDVLEEIVGDINDEYDEEEATYRKLPDDTYVFEGKTLLTDFFRITGLDEEQFKDITDDCETLAGMLLAIKGDFIKEKEPVAYGRCRFLVLDVTGHRITSVRVKILPEETP